MSAASTVRDRRSVRDRLGMPASSSSMATKPLGNSDTVQPDAPAPGNVPVPESVSISLRMIEAGMIAMVVDPSVDQAWAASFTADMAFFISGSRSAVDATLFNWPPPGMQTTLSEAQAAASSHIKRLKDTRSLTGVMLFGEQAKAALLDETTGTVAGLPAIAVACLSEYRHQPISKRVLWPAVSAFKSRLVSLD